MFKKANICRFQEKTINTFYVYIYVNLREIPFSEESLCILYSCTSAGFIYFFYLNVFICMII